MPASVHKVASVLDLFSLDRPDWGASEVADELGIAKSTAAGSGLEPGELERTRRHGYAVGAQRALEGVDCAAAAVRTSDGRRPLPSRCAPRVTVFRLGVTSTRGRRRRRADGSIRSAVANGHGRGRRGGGVLSP